MMNPITGMKKQMPRNTALAVVRGDPGAYNIVEDGGAASNAKARARLGLLAALSSPGAPRSLHSSTVS